MIGYRCKNCMWFDQEHTSLQDVPDNLGYCRKHKPMVYAIQQRYYGAFPLLDINDLCGEFREDAV